MKEHREVRQEVSQTEQRQRMRFLELKDPRNPDLIVADMLLKRGFHIKALETVDHEYKNWSGYVDVFAEDERTGEVLERIYATSQFQALRLAFRGTFDISWAIMLRTGWPKDTKRRIKAFFIQRTADWWKRSGLYGKNEDTNRLVSNLETKAELHLRGLKPMAAGDIREFLEPVVDKVLAQVESEGYVEYPNPD